MTSPDSKVQSLLALSKEASKLAYAPFSNFPVGAALMTKCGRTFTGCNVENSSYGLSICAERTAAVKAVSEGFREFSTIAVFAPTSTPTYPCGACRQFLFEFGPDMMIHVTNERESKSHNIKDLLLYGFRF